MADGRTKVAQEIFMHNSVTNNSEAQKKTTVEDGFMYEICQEYIEEGLNVGLKCWSINGELHVQATLGKANPERLERLRREKNVSSI